MIRPHDTNVTDVSSWGSNWHHHWPRQWLDAEEQNRCQANHWANDDPAHIMNYNNWREDYNFDKGGRSSNICATSSCKKRFHITYDEQEQDARCKVDYQLGTAAILSFKLNSEKVFEKILPYYTYTIDVYVHIIKHYNIKILYRRDPKVFKYMNSKLNSDKDLKYWCHLRREPVYRHKAIF